LRPFIFAANYSLLNSLNFTIISWIYDWHSQNLFKSWIVLLYNAIFNYFYCGWYFNVLLIFNSIDGFIWNLKCFAFIIFKSIFYSFITTPLIFYYFNLKLQFADNFINIVLSMKYISHFYFAFIFKNFFFPLAIDSLKTRQNYSTNFLQEIESNNLQTLSIEFEFKYFWFGNQ
jgi:hypothetical protein